MNEVNTFVVVSKLRAESPLLKILDVEQCSIYTVFLHHWCETFYFDTKWNYRGVILIQKNVTSYSLYISNSNTSGNNKSKFLKKCANKPEMNMQNDCHFISMQFRERLAHKFWCSAYVALQIFHAVFVDLCWISLFFFFLSLWSDNKN